MYSAVRPACSPGSRPGWRVSTSALHHEIHVPVKNSPLPVSPPPLLIHRSRDADRLRALTSSCSCLPGPSRLHLAGGKPLVLGVAPICSQGFGKTAVGARLALRKIPASLNVPFPCLLTRILSSTSRPQGVSLHRDTAEVVGLAKAPPPRESCHRRIYAAQESDPEANRKAAYDKEELQYLEFDNFISLTAHTLYLIVLSLTSSHSLDITNPRCCPTKLLSTAWADWGKQKKLRAALISTDSTGFSWSTCSMRAFRWPPRFRPATRPGMAPEGRWKPPGSS